MELGKTQLSYICRHSTAQDGCSAVARLAALEQLERAYVSVQIPPHVTKGMPSPPSRELCESYRRLAEATEAWVEYARQRDELCRFSGLLPMMEREYLRAVEERDNVCAGRPPRPGFSIFPAERGIRR